MSPTKARDHACKLAYDDPAGAARTARTISDPWFACQALAWAARFAPAERVERWSLEAIQIGLRHRDLYKAVGCTAWPLRALVERDQTTPLDNCLDEPLELAQEVTPPASRSEALHLLFEAVMPAEQCYWEKVFNALQASSDPATHWRQRRNLRDAIMMVNEANPNLAEHATARITDDITRHNLALAKARGEHRQPRTFFWPNPAK